MSAPHAWFTQILLSADQVTVSCAENQDVKPEC